MVNRSTSSWPSSRPAPDRSCSSVSGGEKIPPRPKVVPGSLGGLRGGAQPGPPRIPRPVLFLGQWRVIIAPEAEVRPRELGVVEVRIAAEPHQDRLRDRLEQRLVGEDEPAKLPLLLGARPVILGAERHVTILRDVERA